MYDRDLDMTNSLELTNFFYESPSSSNNILHKDWMEYEQEQTPHYDVKLPFMTNVKIWVGSILGGIIFLNIVKFVFGLI